MLHSYIQITPSVAPAALKFHNREEPTIIIYPYPGRTFLEHPFGFQHCPNRLFDEGIVVFFHNLAILDASLCATCFYEYKGYKTISHNKISTDNGFTLAYGIMEKPLTVSSTRKTAFRRDHRKAVLSICGSKCTACYNGNAPKKRKMTTLPG